MSQKGADFSPQELVFLTIQNFLHQEEAQNNQKDTLRAFRRPGHPLYTHVAGKITNTPVNAGGASTVTGPGAVTGAGGGGSGTGTAAAMPAEMIKFLADLSQIVQANGGGAEARNGNGDDMGSGTGGSSAVGGFGEGVGTAPGDGNNSTVRLTDLLASVSRMAKANAQLGRQLEKVRADEAKLLVELERLNAQDSQQRIAQLEAINDGLHASLVAEREKTQKLDGERLTAENEARVAGIEKAAWSREKALVSRMNDKLNNQVSSLQTQVSILLGKLSDKREQLLLAVSREKATATENRQLQINNETFQCQISELEENLSWSEEERRIHTESTVAKFFPKFPTATKSLRAQKFVRGFLVIFQSEKEA
ncbi:hypothetical protein HDV00_004674 [Rhizophlyctis rosea]|nr:hypothetical protein HDV00_004674 [Rhizophlyctis rosea]